MMRVSMTFARSRRAWRSSIEQFEERALLSALVGQFVPTTTLADSVKVLELSLIDNHVETAETAQPIALAELPEAVTAAVRDQVPGATIVSADRDAGSGAVQFGVRAELGGIEFDITVSPAGNVLEIERPVTASGLPQSVQDWLSHRFPQATILEAGLVVAGGSVSYQLTIATPAQPTVEALLRVSNSNSLLTPPALNDSTGRADRGFTPRVPPSAANQTNSASDVAITEPQTTPSDERAATHDAPVAVRVAADERSNVASLSEAVRAAGVGLNRGESKPTAKPADLASEPTSATWRTAIAGVLTDALPVDMGTIERAMREFLDGVGSLAEQAVEDGAAQRWLPTLLTAIVALFGAERLISERQKSDQNFVVAAAGKSSWSWVMKLSTLSHSQER